MACVGGLRSPAPTASPLGSVTVRRARAKRASSTRANLLRHLPLPAVVSEPAGQRLCVVLGMRSAADEVELHEFDLGLLQELGGRVDQLRALGLISPEARRIDRSPVDHDAIRGAAQMLGDLLHMLERIETVGLAILGHYVAHVEERRPGAAQRLLGFTDQQLRDRRGDMAAGVEHYHINPLHRLVDHGLRSTTAAPAAASMPSGIAFAPSGSISTLLTAPGAVLTALSPLTTSPLSFVTTRETGSVVAG